MNRQILFRGKQIDNGEWIYGDLINAGFSHVDGSHVVFIQNDVDEYDVLPETVGQFTGLTDKTGKKIFEGDILFDGVLNYTVKYSPCSCGFEAFGKSITGIWSLFHLAHKGNCGREIEIIGNIHDTPELLGDPK